jgi:hypothetical protein
MTFEKQTAGSEINLSHEKTLTREICFLDTLKTSFADEPAALPKK